MEALDVARGVVEPVVVHVLVGLEAHEAGVERDLCAKGDESVEEVVECGTDSREKVARRVPGLFANPAIRRQKVETTDLGHGAYLAVELGFESAHGLAVVVLGDGHIGQERDVGGPEDPYVGLHLRDRDGHGLARPAGLEETPVERIRGTLQDGAHLLLIMLVERLLVLVLVVPGPLDVGCRARLVDAQEVVGPVREPPLDRVGAVQAPALQVLDVAADAGDVVEVDGIFSDWEKTNFGSHDR